MQNILLIFLLGGALFYSRKIYRFILFYITKNQYDFYGIQKHQQIRHMELEAMFEQEFHYFKSLSPKARTKFLARLWHVYNKVEFFGYGELTIQENMKLRVLFSQIQLTFGLRHYYFKNFKKYILYPTAFYSNYFERDLKGLTSNAGFITLSWANFELGYDEHFDKFNLGLHEMAHAFRLHIANASFTFNLTQLHIDFDKIAKAEMFMAERGVPSILRDYALTNHEEFFAVCIEYFFEAPELLKNTLPKIFYSLCSILNQNPLNHNKDYRIN